MQIQNIQEQITRRQQISGRERSATAAVCEPLHGVFLLRGENMTNEELVERIQSGADPGKNMELLYDQVKDFIRSIAWQYRETGEMDDLMHEGYLALYPAIDNYDPAAGCQVLTYAARWIRQRMQRYIQNNGSCLRLPVHCLEQIRKMKWFQSDYVKKYGREATEAEIVRFMGVTLEQIREWQENACMTNVGSLDAPITGADGSEDSAVGDFVPAAGDLAGDIADQMEHEELRRVLWDCVDSLPGIQADVIRNRYRERMTLKQCGVSCGVSATEARKQHGKALQKLRSYENSARLRPFLPEYDRIYSGALAGNGAEHFRRTWTSSTERVALGL